MRFILMIITATDHCKRTWAYMMQDLLPHASELLMLSSYVKVTELHCREARSNDIW